MNDLQDHDMPANDAFQGYQQWVTELSSLLNDYEQWRTSHDMDVSFINTAQTHTSPSIRLVITGEFGRGKTEFVNALLAEHAGHRLLPVHVGRATMTPLEIFHDPSASPYLKLLPIEARFQNQSIDWFKSIPEQWTSHDLDTSKPEDMRLLLQEVAKTKPVTLAVAEQLGFNIDFLEACDTQADHVLVPAWQHALLNVDFPRFKQGLCIVDTPGFNALGMEGLLSQEIINTGQAHMHVLSVETGVTASDYKLWCDDILPASLDQCMPLFVLINKLDLLDANEEPIVNSLSRIKRTGAKQLNLPEKQFFAMSAKFANTGLTKKDATMRKRSGFDFFCDHFFPTLVSSRIQHIQQGLLGRISQQLDDDIASHRLEVKRLQKDLEKLTNTQDDVEKNYLTTKDGIADETHRVNKLQSLFDENMRDIDLSHEHIKHIFSDKQFATHKERSVSLLKNDASKDVTEEVKKARNVLLAGLRLDMKRIAMDITVLNNSMRALFKDMESQFEPSSVHVNHFTDYIEKIESASIQKTGDSAYNIFDTQVIKELNDMFRKQRKLIATWYDSHVATVKEPLDLALSNLTERQVLAEQLENKIIDRKAHLAFARERMPVAKNDLTSLERIKSGLEAFG